MSPPKLRFRSRNRPIVDHHQQGDKKGRAVLNNLSEQIRNCLQHAEDCARKAAAQPDQKLKQDLLDMERRWLVLAQSYDFTHRLGDFCDEATRRADNLHSDGQRAALIAPGQAFCCEVVQ
jgi:hypothetical protein